MKKNPASRKFSFLVLKRIPAGQEAQFGPWLAQLIATSAKFSSHLAVDSYRLQEGDEQTYEVVLQFNSGEDLARWRNSEERQQLLGQLRKMA